MSLSADDVRKVARLARLTLTEAEVAQFSSQLARILDYAEMLNEVPTDHVQPMVHAIEVANVLRPDDLAPSLPRAEAVANAPRTDGKYFQVPAILDAS